MELYELALSNSKYFHLLAIPFIVAGLVVVSHKNMPDRFSISPVLGLTLIGLGGTILFLSRSAHRVMDTLCLSILSFVLCFIGSVTLVFGRETILALRFPVFFLLLFVPVPTVIDHVLTVGLQHASADAIDALFKLSGTPVYRDGFIFSLPGLTIEVQQRGLGSTFLLFVMTLALAKIVLDSRWKKAILILLVLPLSVLRNAMEIFILALLTIHVDPNIVAGPLNRLSSSISFIVFLWILFVSLLVLH